MYHITPSVFSIDYFSNYVRLITLAKIFSRRHIEICFLFLPGKQDLTFNGDNLHEMSNPVFRKNKDISPTCRLLLNNPESDKV